MPWSMCSVHCLREPEGALRFSEFGSRKQIFHIELFSSKIADVVFFQFHLKLFRVLDGCALCCMFVFPCLSVLRKVKRVLAFSKLLALIWVAL